MRLLRRHQMQWNTAGPGKRQWTQETHDYPGHTGRTIWVIYKENCKEHCLKDRRAGWKHNVQSHLILASQWKRGFRERTFLLQPRAILPSAAQASEIVWLLDQTPYLSGTQLDDSMTQYIARPVPLFVCGTDAPYNEGKSPKKPRMKLTVKFAYPELTGQKFV